MRKQTVIVIAFLLLVFLLACEAGGSDYLMGPPSARCARTVDRCSP